MLDKEDKGIKLFFLKKKITASIFIALISIFLISNIVNLYNVRDSISIESGNIENTINEEFLGNDVFKNIYDYIQRIMFI